jgi:predicted RNase H-like HicB family nuclease
MLTYTVELEPQKEGGYTVTVPVLPGCISEGDTLEEALKNIKDAIEGYLKVLAKHGRPIPLEFSEFYKIEVFKKRKPGKVRNLIHA